MSSHTALNPFRKDGEQNASSCFANRNESLMPRAGHASELSGTPSVVRCLTQEHNGLSLQLYSIR
eukprot:5670242-Amphidinium_carterae.1